MMKYVRFYCIRCNVFPDAAKEVIFDEYDECYTHDCGSRIAMTIALPNDPSRLALFRQDAEAVETPTDWTKYLPRVQEEENGHEASEETLGMPKGNDQLPEEVGSTEEAIVHAQEKNHATDPSTLVFSELPYAKALHVNFLGTRCSWCFTAASHPCQYGCGLVYCNDECAKNDRSVHESECHGFRQGRDRRCPISADLRLCGRIAARLRMDGGEVVLSDGLPEYVKNRKFADLMTHYEEYTASESANHWLQQALDSYYDFYRSTPIAQIDRAQVAKIYCAIHVNCYVLFEPTSVFTSGGAGAGGFTEANLGEIGWGLYIESSRVDHSCRQPDLHWRHDGLRMYMHRNLDKTTVDLGSNEAFNRLTITYATPLDKGCLVASRSYLRELMQNWFFRCECEQCSDQIEIELEENSAHEECAKCNVPFVWDMTGAVVKLKQVCQCTEVRLPECEMEESDRGTLRELEAKWLEIQNSDETDPTLVQSLYESALPFAEKYWHPTRNLRLAQLYDRLFNAYFTSIFRRSDITQVDKDTIKKAIDMGEKMMKAYEKLKKGRFTGRFAAPCIKMATLHGMISGRDGEEAKQWMREAERILERNGDYRNLELLHFRHTKSAEMA